MSTKPEVKFDGPENSGRVKDGPVCVTGASGFVASNIIRMLLEKGYVVHGTVRNKSNKKKVGHLMSLPGATERLKLFEADLLKEGSFKDAIAGCACVMHTASPFFWKSATEESLVTPALKGTENVLGSVTASGTVKTVVLTSSTASITVATGRDTNHVITEKDWSDTKFMREHKIWYPLSKTLAEKKAMEMEKEAGGKWKLVVMCPSLVWGPMLQPTVNTSSSVVMNYLDGTENALSADKSNTVVDVRNVALAHILGYENKEASGRYLLIGGNVLASEVCSILREKEPENANIPKQSTKELKPPSKVTVFSCAKATKELGIKFISPRDQVLATYESLKHHNLHPK
eukprot:jgi/Bigna1/56312/estExt_Genewise1Plus.C_930029